MDSDAFNYNPSATTPRFCIKRRPGCTDRKATNYYRFANIDDGSW